MSLGLESRISHGWFFLPVAIIAGVLLIPLGLALVSWRRDRSLRRGYPTGSAGLPPLPQRDA